jgi:hypothetical protein
MSPSYSASPHPDPQRNPSPSIISAPNLDNLLPVHTLHHNPITPPRGTSKAHNLGIPIRTFILTYTLGTSTIEEYGDSLDVLQEFCKIHGIEEFNISRSTDDRPPQKQATTLEELSFKQDSPSTRPSHQTNNTPIEQQNVNLNLERNTNHNRNPNLNTNQNHNPNSNMNPLTKYP